MRILFLARATLYTVYGGDTIQILSTAKYLRKLGVDVDIRLANEKISYKQYDLLHVFNVIRPADVLMHVKQSGLPVVLSTIYVDYSEYQREHARGIPLLLNKFFTSDGLEYLKVIARWIRNGEKINSPEYLFSGHWKAVRKLAKSAACLLPNSESEYKRFSENYRIELPYKVIYNGVDPEVFMGEMEDGVISKPNAREVLCVSRIEGKKNHLNLIKALNNTPFHLRLIGKPAPNHIKYYEACRKIAADNISFHDFVPQEELISYYKQAKIHVLPSWNETTGLSSLEAAYYNCNLVITDKGDTTEYFGTEAWYCDPSDPQSIYDAVVKASEAGLSNILKQKISATYNWHNTAVETLKVYESILKSNFSAK